MRPRRRVTRCAEPSVDPSSTTMTSAAGGSVSSKFSTVLASSRPSFRLMTTTLTNVPLAAIRIQPDVAFELAHGKEQRAISHRQAGQEAAAPDEPQRKARRVKVADGEGIAGRAFGPRIELAGPYAPEAVALR